MIGRLAFVVGRSIAAAVFLATWAYGVTTYSPFAFDMFVAPRLMPGLTTFVDWHHVFYWIGLLASGLTLVAELRGARGRTARYASIGYLVAFGGIGIYLLSSPYLVMLTTGSRSTAVVPGALIPLVWLAVIDHLSAGAPADRQEPQGLTGQRALLVSCVATVGVVWGAHFIVAALNGRVSTAAIGWLPTAVASLTLDVAALAVVFAVLSAVSAVASMFTRARNWERYLTAVALAIGLTEWCRRSILPSFAFATADTNSIAIGIGCTLAFMWSGLAARRAATRDISGMAAFVSPSGSRLAAAALLMATPVIAAWGFRRVEGIDWADILRSLITLVEATITFGAALAICSARRDASWSILRATLPPLVSVLALAAMPSVITAGPHVSNAAPLDAQDVLDRAQSADALAGFAADRLFARPSFDIDYFRQVLASETRPSSLQPAVPADTLARPAAETATPRPDVYVFVVDSLRRDYLSPYNPRVTFTPAIESWAAGSYVFRNAFTRYGGTWLSMPSIWTGSVVTRGWTRIFSRMNALEALITGSGFDWVINDFTVAPLLKPESPRTFIEPEIPSGDTDLCRNVQWLRERLTTRAAGSPPMFAFVAPMNVHLMNTHRASQEGAGTYPGFYPPYASRLERIDACFGTFIQFLKAQHLYDNSIIVLTSDHGDDLGEDGRWGHQFYLFPEVMRIPFVVHLPPQMREHVTADLSRLTFSMDLTPTLAALLGQPVGDLGPLFGAPLFVPPDQEPRPRRHDDFLVMSSYGSTYGLLRRNGRSLYISDLLDWREYAMTMQPEPYGTRVPVDPATRTLSQQRIRHHLDEVDRLYGQR